MSLQLWLPFNGNLKNQGLLKVAIPTTNVTYDSGKIGEKSLKSNVKVSYDISSANISTHQLSFSFWAKSDVYTGTDTTWWQLCSFKCSDATQFHVYCVSNARYKIEYNPELNTYCNTTLWHHLTYVLDGTKLTIYTDGVQTAQANVTNVNRILSSISFGVNTVCINDFRLYDHCLSKKEVQEISKGLILHMPLDNNGMGGENIFLNSLKEVSNNSYMVNAYTPEEFLEVGETYTMTTCFTAPANVTNYDIYVSGGYRKLSAYTVPGPGTYVMSKTFTVGYYSGKEPSVSASYGNVQLYRQPNNNTVTENSTIHWSKIEKGSKATAWSPNPTDNGNNPLHIYETSGYNYQGTAVQRMNILPDTPRYNVSTQWKDATDFIHIPNFFASNQLIDEITIAGWFKTNNLNNTAPNMFNYGANEFVRARIISSTSLWSYWNINGSKKEIYADAGKTLNDNTWHHYAFSFNKGIIKTYIDGILKNTTNHTATGTQLKVGSITNWGLGGFQPTGEKFLGYQSDFRTYCTALEDSEILELYEGRPGVDNDGNGFFYKIEENETTPVGIKNTCVAMAPRDFYEDDIENIAYNQIPYDYTGVVHSKTPTKNGTNQTLTPGFKIHYGGKHMHNKKAKISMTVEWNGFDTSSTAGTFDIRFQGAVLLQDGTTSWTNPAGASNQACTALMNAKNLKTLVLSATSGSYNYETEFTIKCGTGDDFAAGHVVSMRADYSNGTGWIKFSNIKVTPMDAFSSDDQPFKISKNNIASNYIYEF